MYDLGAVMGAKVTMDDSQYMAKLQGLDTSSENTFKKIAGYAAMYLSFRAVSSFAANAIKAYNEQEQAVVNLTAALRNAGQEITGNVASANRFASEMQKLTQYGDELTIGVMAQGINLGVAPAQIEQATKAAMVLAQKYSMDLPTAMTLLGRAGKGHTETLARYGITLDETATKEEQFQQLLKLGTDEFNIVTEAAESNIKTMQKYDNVIGDSMEVIGQRLVPVLLNAKGAVAGLADKFNSATPETQRLVMNIAALSAAMLLLQTSAGKAANAKIIGLAGMFDANTAKLGAAAVVAAEKTKELAAERSAASRIAIEKKRHLLEMQNLAKEASAALSAARAKMNTALNAGPLPKKEFNTNYAAVIAAEKQYAAAKAATVMANKEYMASLALAKNARAAEITQLRIAAAAQNAFTVSKTLGAKAANVLYAGLMTATAGVRAFFASLGPIGWAILALSGIMAIADRMEMSFRKIQDQSREASEATGKAMAAFDTGDTTRAADLAKIERLKELSKYTKLNNAEIEEAKKLNEQLRKSYGVVTAEIDENTKTVKVHADAVKTANEQMVKARKLEQESRIDAGFAELKALEIEMDAVINKKLSLFSAVADVFTDDAEIEKAKEVTAISEKKLALQKKLIAMQQEFAAQAGLATAKTEADANADAKTLSDKERQAQDKLKDQKFSQDYTNAEKDSERIALINKRLDELKEKQIAIRGDKEKELEIEYQIRDVLNEKSQLEKKIADDRKKSRQAIADENKAAEKIREDDEKAQAKKAIDRSIEDKLKDGNKSGAVKIMEDELAKAREAASAMQQQYERAYARALEDNKLTTDEQKKLDEVKEKWREVLSEQRGWEDRIYSENKQEEKKNVVGAWSAELLGQMIGAGSPQERAAKAAEKNVKLLVDIRDNTKNNSDESEETYA